jgi:hypothetical protein
MDAVGAPKDPPPNSVVKGERGRSAIFSLSIIHIVNNSCAGFNLV